MTNPKTYLVTGAGRGIGLELVRQLLAKGENIIATVRDAKKADRLLALERESGGRLRLETLNVDDADSSAAFADRLKGIPIDTLINNAGVLMDAGASLANASLDAVRAQFETNAIGPMRVTQSLLPNLRLSKNASVANISSLMGSIADNKSGGAYGYRMSKTALNMFTKCLANGEPDILAVCFHPGWVKTEMGGSRATTEISDSAAGIIDALSRLKREDTGSFYDFQGRKLPW